MDPALEETCHTDRMTPMSELPTGYSMIRGSDIVRDGMFLELIDCISGDVVAEVFYSDASQKMTDSVFQPALPLELIEMLITRANADLPPEIR